MIRVTSQAPIGDDDIHAAAYHYAIAKQSIVFQSRVASIKKYEAGPASHSFNQLLKVNKAPNLLNQSNAELRYKGMAPINTGFAQITYWHKKELAQIDVNGEPLCQVDFANSHIHVLNDASFDTPVNLEIVLGPALIMLLSKQEMYCLHASAVATEHGNFALIAESGTGKSTLSKHVGAHWRQLADDILPLEFNDGIELVHQFPQLKLANASIDERPRQPALLNCVIRLSGEPANETQFRHLSRPEALLQIVRHTVAAKLFDQDLMRHHARFAKRVTLEVPMIEVQYPRDLSKLDKLRSEIINYVQQLA